MKIRLRQEVIWFLTKSRESKKFAILDWPGTKMRTHAKVRIFLNTVRIYLNKVRIYLNTVRIYLNMVRIFLNTVRIFLNNFSLFKKMRTLNV